MQNNFTSLLIAVRRLYDAMDQFDSRLADHLEVDRTALRAINAMESGSASPTELASRLGLTSGSVTALLDRLEVAGHVTRRPSPTDRRRRDAVLRPRTHARASRQYAALAQSISSAFAAFTPDQLSTAELTLLLLASSFRPPDAHQNQGLSCPSSPSCPA